MIRIFAFAILFVGLTAANAAEVQTGSFQNRPILKGQVISTPIVQTPVIQTPAVQTPVVKTGAKLSGGTLGQHNNLMPWIGSNGTKDPRETTCSFCSGHDGGVGWHPG